MGETRKPKDTWYVAALVPLALAVAVVASAPSGPEADLAAPATPR